MNQFELLEHIVKTRRSVSWGKMNGRIIEDSVVNQVLALADWAPTHGRTEPWRFFVYGGEALKQFGRDHAALYWEHTPEETRQEATREKLEKNVEKASHLVVAVMKRGANEKIPLLEEIASASASIENVLLGATALGISSFWSSGGMTHKPALRDYLKLSADDLVLGLIYLGYTDEPLKDGVRAVPLTEKITWM